MLIGTCFQWFTPDGFRSLLALVGTNGQGIGTSSFSRWVKNVSALELPKDERIYIDKLIERIYDAMDEGNFYLYNLFFSRAFNKYSYNF